MNKIKLNLFYFFNHPFFFRYRVVETEAVAFINFLLKMLKYHPHKRASARTCLKDPWLTMEARQNYKMTEEEFKEYMDKKNHMSEINTIFTEYNDCDSDENDGDKEDNDFINLSVPEDEKFYGKRSNKIDMKILDRSFCNLGYIGFGEGINLEELDSHPNWQFEGLK